MFTWNNWRDIKIISPAFNVKLFVYSHSWRYFYFVFFELNFGFLFINTNASFSYKHFYMIRWDEKINSFLCGVYNKYRKFSFTERTRSCFRLNASYNIFLNAMQSFLCVILRVVYGFIYFVRDDQRFENNSSISIHISLLPLQHFAVWQDRNQ